MANKNTRRARKNGFCSSQDENRNGNRIFEGSCCDTSWDAKASRKRSRKVYRKQGEN
jgi:hypothetical protein